MKRNLICFVVLILGTCLFLGLSSYVREKSAPPPENLLPTETERAMKEALEEFGNLVEEAVNDQPKASDRLFALAESSKDTQQSEPSDPPDSQARAEAPEYSQPSEPPDSFASQARTEPDKDSAPAVYSCGKLEIVVPEEYLSKLIIVENQDGWNGYQPVVSFYEKASVEAAQKDFGSNNGLGFLFEFALVRRDNYQSVMDDQIPGRNFFAEDVKHYYVFTRPTDVRLYRSGGASERDQAVWEELTGLGPELRDDAFRRGLVDAFTAPAAPNVTAPPARPADPSRKECFLCGGSGFCNTCLGVGSCGSCHGMGRSTCLSCSGLRHCFSCARNGYVYEGVGLMHQKVTCKSCKGTGGCLSCNNTGYLICAVCGGDGHCNTCSGLALCSICNGSGYF